MDPRTVIAQRIDLKLRHQLGAGVDAQRTLDDALYARDVLLVCDAMQGTDLPLLARQFRVAGEHMAAERRAQQRAGHDAGRAQDWATDTSGFGVSRPPVVAARDERAGKPSWFSPSRWLG